MSKLLQAIKQANGTTRKHRQAENRKAFIRKLTKYLETGKV